MAFAGGLFGERPQRRGTSPSSMLAGSVAHQTLGGFDGVAQLSR